MKKLILISSIFFLLTSAWSEVIEGPYYLDNDSIDSDPVTGIALPPGFEATVFADTEGYARHMAVRDDGTVYLALTVRMGRGSNMGIVAMQDNDNDGVADVIEKFATHIPGTALQFYNGYLYFGSKTAIYRFEFEGDNIVPIGDPEIVVDGFPEQDRHEAKTFAIDDQDNLFVNVGTPSNSCAEEFRTRGSPGMFPCPHLEIQSGVWKFSASKLNQTQSDDGVKYATGIRNAVAIEWSDEHKKIYFLNHGRDALFLLYPEYYTAEDSAELPSEEMHILTEGANYGWPYTYYDHIKGERMLAPEYGGDGQITSDDDIYEEPIANFPGHWAPNDMMFYKGDQFPDYFKNGAFVVWHGSWNRAPIQQAGYKIIFVPFRDDMPTGDWQDFADKFSGRAVLENPADAVHRPTGIVEGVNGEIYVSSTVSGRVWQIKYIGE
jgi:glucose/arabinose dehydrogenase